MFIGFACLPQTGQLLPKNHQCTIIGWGKRRNTDEAGTSILHEAEVNKWKNGEDSTILSSNFLELLKNVL